MLTDELEQAAWNEAYNAAADQTPEAAPVEDTAVAAAPDAEAAAHTEESEPETEEVVEETGEATPTDEPEAPAEEGELDTQDLLDPLPTKDQIFQSEKWKRIPNEAKEAMAGYVEQARTFRDQMEAIGGTEAIELFKPVSNLLTKPDPTVEDSVGAYASLFKANHIAAARMVIDASTHFLNSDEPGFKDVGAAIVRDVFGDGVTVERLRGLLKLEEAGFVNLDEDLPAVEENGSTLFKKQETALSQAQQKIRELEDLIKNPEKIASASEVNAEAEFTKDFDKRFTDAVTPFIQRGRWTEAKALSQFVSNAILSELRNDPQYKDVVKHVKQNGAYSAENATFAVRQAVNSLINKAKARYDAAIKGVNADLKNLAGSSRNANLKKEIEKQTKPANISLVPKTPPSPFGSTFVDPRAAGEEEAWKEFKASAA